MGTRLTKFGSESGVPGLSHITTSKGVRKFFWTSVVLIFVALTVHDLIDLIQDYVQYPVTVNVRVADSRVLPFPAVTICNLNLVHRGRFCAAEHIDKPDLVKNILCANLGDLLSACKVNDLMDDLLVNGKEVCGIKEQTSPMVVLDSSKNSKKKKTNEVQKSNRRGKRQLPIRDILKTVKEVGNAIRGDGTKGSSLIDVFNDFQESLKSLAEGTGGPLDETLTQLANFLGFNVTNSLDILPALFMKAFTDTTGCRIGSGDIKSVLPDNMRLTLKSLTKIFLNNQCFLKAPRLVKLFHEVSQKMFKTLNSCSTPWIETLKESIKKGETPWFFLLDLLSSWLADLGKNHPEQAKEVGHHAPDLIQQCIFAGRICSAKIDFSHFFYNSYGNCFTYNLHINDSQSQTSLSGFTGPKFGLEMVLNLETEQYMPTSKESGAKIIVHDSTTRADPDQDSVHVAPGLVTYIGVKMVNITRLPNPYPDKCSNEWNDEELERWAKELSYEAYSTQICLKLCLQRYTIQFCHCWSPSSPPPKENVTQCNNRKNKGHELCSENIRQMYYNETINCDCPPRCSELTFEKFVSTGQELQQCSILTSFGVVGHQEEKENEQINESTIKDDNENDIKTEAEYKVDKSNIAKVVVYFQSLSYQEITQYPKYTLTTLLGGIGGILGVYMGFSFLALFELFEIFGRVFMCGDTGNGGNKNNEVEDSQSGTSNKDKKSISSDVDILDYQKKRKGKK